MSGKHSDKDGFVFAPYGIHPVLLQREIEYFDQSVELDIKEHIQLKKEIKVLKRMCFIRVATAPIELFFSWLLLEKKWHKTKVKEAKLSLKFILGRIDYDEFNRQHNELIMSHLK